MFGFQAFTYKKMSNRITSIFSYILAFLAPLESTLVAIIFICLISGVTDIWSDVRKSKADLSKLLLGLFTKIILYSLAIIAAFSGETAAPLVPWVAVVSGGIASLELTKILKNVSEITGADIWENVKKILKKNEPQN